MSEFRKNPFTGEWTVYAQKRKNRPYEFRWQKAVHKGGDSCPFCVGHEERTTPALFQNETEQGWNIRVFPNMYPVVDEKEQNIESDPFYENAAGIGHHEVIVDTPVHEESIDQFTETHMRLVLDVLRQRYELMRAEKETAYVQIFKNCGAEAGMSIRHSHWQMIGIPVVPRRIQIMLEKGIGEECLFCRSIDADITNKKRLVYENESMAAITPYGSRYPYEVWIMPKNHRDSFGSLRKEELRDLADMLCRILPKMASLRENTGYNLCFMDGPKGMDFHWHLEILPRIGGFAGFEHATDCYINPITPETAAAYYRGEKKPFEE
ncbi:DUF4931 domain-containing protein [Anaerotignum lactatifermentans]|uniref:DUF4931 domain-containing protein n=1 Tax=Anaerotignum lactatifermentans TaxID=160404 RepID=A0ABS2GDE3_9FIRM|nr:DUF4931 domain-containing protein [Anaerotignum lactatifermentans]MBM6830202.1 DUF4931 domain-containing protein [Anaerotignum lactatifermentans]MBM6878725.1 DUF4931 domain-containing protein [Anaerotignum lactatifermentans]MBM6951789.1 DUF4931 domain-containing protein [Anaerotignum lactatifermentans]